MNRGIMIAELSNYKGKSLNKYLALHFDLHDLIQKMKLNNALKNGEPMAKILLNNRYRQVILTLLQASTEIDSFQGNDSVAFQLIEGKLNFSTRKESVLLEKGQILILNENIKYRLISKKETAFIITLINNASELCKN
jgi:quercetin dioxygenase-like cupin family protein